MWNGALDLQQMPGRRICQRGVFHVFIPLLQCRFAPGGLLVPAAFGSRLPFFFGSLGPPKKKPHSHLNGVYVVGALPSER
jgi:hypothetical protein